MPRRTCSGSSWGWPWHTWSASPWCAGTSRKAKYPPPDDIGENPSILKQIKVYVVECFSHPIYIYTFLSTACMAFAMGAYAGMIIFHRDGIHLSMDDIGKAGMWISGCRHGAGVSRPAGRSTSGIRSGSRC